ncbi:putative aminotransferase family protein [Poronia punctata]|nr:putative aminotransferase family protein [Poronia punctata]
MSGPAVPFGRAMREAHFSFSPKYTPLNHGSYGTYPKSVGAVRAALVAEAESAPDPFIALSWAGRLREPRALVAAELHCDADDLVLVPNATTGSDTVLKNLRWEAGDVVLVYDLVYEALRAGLAWLEENFDVRVHVVHVPFPAPDDDVVDAMVSAAREIKNNGERLRLAVVDTIISMPGLRVPFEKLVPALQAEGALVLVDGAHGIGQIDLDIGALNPDFMVTNLHKWFFVPRGCAALYVARRHHGIIRTTLPTAAAFRRRGTRPEDEGPSALGALFNFIASVDNTNFLTVQAAIDFRNQVCGGEQVIRSYCRTVARQGAEAAAALLGTEIMSSERSCMLDCALINVRMPLELADGNDSDGKIDPASATKLVMWIKRTGVEESGCYLQTCLYRGAFWWRLSGMIYVEVDDFRYGADVLKGLCERAKKGEYLS